MNALNLARHAYDKQSAIMRTPRDMEYEAFSRVTRQLQKIQNEKHHSPTELARALHENRRLWTVLACDVMSDGNQLPDALKAQILYLSEFSNQHSRKILQNQDDVQPLIEINTAVMRGLRNGSTL